MKTNPECIPCFLNQALNVMKTSDDLDNETKTAILKKILNELAKFDSELSPPEFALFIYKTIEDALGNKSFYDKIK